VDQAITLFFQPSKGEPEMAKEILIADSDKGDREEFQSIFKTTNYNIVFSESGEQASLRVKLFKPDLIILGAHLSGKSGLEVFKEIKAEVESKHIPIIFLSNIFEEFSEEDQKRVQADGVITKPFHGDEILNLVDRLIEGEEMQSKDEKIVGREMEWKSIADIEKIPSEEKKESLLDQAGEAEQEEIIDLVDVAEEPDVKMSINDFVAPEKEEPTTGITPLESWEKLIEEEKPADKSFKFALDETERDAKGLSLKLDEDSFIRSETSNKELLNKIELEEILQKMEQMVPSIEKELPSEIKLDLKPEVKQKAPEPTLPIIEEPSERVDGLAEFEAALKKGVGAETTEEEVSSFQFEKLKKELTEEEVVLIKEPEKERVETLKEKETLEAEEELRIFGDSLKERSEILEEAPKISREEVKIFKEPEEKRIGPLEEGREDEEKLRIFGDSLKELSEILEEAPKITREEVKISKEPEEERIELLEEEGPEVEEELQIFEEPVKKKAEILEEAPEISREEVKISKGPEEERVELLEEEGPEVEEELRIFEEPVKKKEKIFEEAPEITREEVRIFKEPEEERIELLEEEGPEVEEELRIFEEPMKKKEKILEEAPEISREEVSIFEEPEEERIELLEEKEPKIEEELRIFEEPMKKKAEILEEAPEITREEVSIFEEPEEERIELLEEEGPEVEEKEIQILGESMKEMRKIFEEAPEIPKEEVKIFDKPQERVEMFEDTGASELIVPIVQEKEVIPPSREVDRQMEEVISKGVREMMEGFITKLIPEITQSIIHLTIKRIEQMVKEIIPELAEKMIREEIKRLQKDEKD
jgi:DNA-binding response OmpR family regulator